MIKRHLLLLASFATALVLPTAAVAEDDQTPLGAQMEIMGDAFKALRRQAGDPAENASTLQLLNELRGAAIKSLEFKPAYTDAQPAAEQAAFASKFKADMQDFIKIVDEAIAAVQAGDNTRAEELVAAMRNAQRSGHRAYQAPRD